MKHLHLKGRNYINLIRCSDDTQADTSPVDQAKVMHAYAVDYGMVHAGDDVVLEGVTGSMPGARTDIDAIIDRKRRRDDFDVVVVQDFSRFTRGGLQHGNKLRWDLAEAGIDVVFCTFGTTGDPDQDGLIESIGYYAAQQQAKTMSYAGTRGQMSSLAGGFIPHSSRIPYGLDRLYVGLNGIERHRIRNLSDGTQQKLAVNEETVLAVYGRNPEKGAPLHYKRQSDEKSLLVSGAPEQVAIVREIFKRRLVDGEGTMRVARSLNDRGVPSPTGKLWQTDTVESIVTNPTYTGVGIAGRYASGLYHIHGDGKDASPKELSRNLREIATRKSKTAKLRPREQWKWQPCPLLVDYLGDENLRTLAMAYQQTSFEKQHRKATAPPKAKGKPGGDRHSHSPYILKGLLTSKQGGHNMTGRTTGPEGKRARYYKINRGNRVPKTGSYLAKNIPAEPLERAILDIIKDVLCDKANLRAAVERAVQQEQSASDEDRKELEPLLAQQAEIAERLTNALMMNESSRKLLASKIGQWEAQAADLERRIANIQRLANGQQYCAPVSVDKLVAAAEAKFAAIAASLHTLPPTAVRTLLQSLVTRLEIDLDTRAVVMDLRLPEGVSLNADGAKDDNELCLVGGKPSASPNQAQWLQGLKIAIIRCEGQRGSFRTPSCFTCSRQAA